MDTSAIARSFGLAALVILAGCSAPPVNESEETPVGVHPAPAHLPPPRASTNSAAPAPSPVAKAPVGVNETVVGSEPEYDVHVIAVVGDSGVNPYHATFYRPNNTRHPCIYIPDFPCEAKAINLTLGTGLGYEELVAQDDAVWKGLVHDVLYWIPRTNIIAAVCPTESGNPFGVCILDDGKANTATGAMEAIGHGTGTAGTITQENSDVLLAIGEGQSGFGAEALHDLGVPIDIQSHSWAPSVPLPLPGDVCRPSLPLTDVNVVHVYGAGNTPGDSTLLYCDQSLPGILAVMGGAPDPNTLRSLSRKHGDYTAYYCRNLPHGTHTTELDVSCGTSFSAPAVAGVMSKALLEVRRATGYTGNTDTETGILDPIAVLTIKGFTDAFNRSATYTPTANDPYGARDPDCGTCISTPDFPVPAQAPWTMWGWGWIDGQILATVVACLLHDECPVKDAAAVAYMQAQRQAKDAIYGSYLG